MCRRLSCRTQQPAIDGEKARLENSNHNLEKCKCGNDIYTFNSRLGEPRTVCAETWHSFE
jgi:hypothetical protein